MRDESDAFSTEPAAKDLAYNVGAGVARALIAGYQITLDNLDKLSMRYEFIEYKKLAIEGELKKQLQVQQQVMLSEADARKDCEIGMFKEYAKLRDQFDVEAFILVKTAGCEIPLASTCSSPSEDEIIKQLSQNHHNPDEAQKMLKKVLSVDFFDQKYADTPIIDPSLNKELTRQSAGAKKLSEGHTEWLKNNGLANHVNDKKTNQHPHSPINCHDARHIYSCRDVKSNYLFLSILGIPFYLSSGKNSGFKGTLFPHCGYSQPNFAWIVKPKIDDAYIRYLKGFCAHIQNLSVMGLVDKDSFGLNALRFGTLPCMLISSLFDGGFWESKLGKILKLRLKKDFPDFYRRYADLPKAKWIHEGDFSNRADINKWERYGSHLMGISSYQATAVLIPSRIVNAENQAGFFKAMKSIQQNKGKIGFESVFGKAIAL